MIHFYLYKITFLPLDKYVSFEQISIVQGKNGISSANYTDVSENEFFIEDEYSLDVLENAKEKFILKYS